MSIQPTPAHSRTYPATTAGAHLNDTGRDAHAASAMARLLLAAEAKAAAAPPRSLDDIKAEFGDFLATVPLHSSQVESDLSLSIHDAAFEKMLADPEYKASVEALIRREFAGDFSPNPPAWISMTIDENGVYSSTAGDTPPPAPDPNVNAVWTREPGAPWKQPSLRRATTEAERKKELKRKRREDMNDLLQRLAEKRRLQARQLQENYDEKFRPGQNQPESGYRHEGIFPTSGFDVVP